MSNKVEIEITETNPKLWHQLANKAARKKLAELGLDWEATEIVVWLPEKGRLLKKSAGYQQLCAIR